LAVAIIIVSLVAGTLLALPLAQVARAQAPFILNIGVQDEMKTRNLIRATYFTTDVWTADVLGPVLDGTVQTDPDTQDLLPYVMVGTDQNGNYALDPNEIGVFDPVDGTTDKWIAFYDVRGLKFHDGTQVEMEDVLIGYHFEAIPGTIGSARFIKDLAGETGSNYTTDRWLWVNPVSVTGWLGGAPADPAHMFAFEFKQTGPNAQFNRDTLQTTIMPAYFWQGTGVRKQDGVVVETNIHPDFGYALNPCTMNGVPLAGATCNGQTLKPFDMASTSSAAPSWAATDRDVIGTGPFKFDTWQPGVIARVVKNPDYFIPRSEYRKENLLRVPALDAMVYRLYRNVQAGIFALQSGEVDFLDWFVPPTFVGPLLADPNIGLKTSADAGYFYLGYNMRRLPFGYQDPSAGSDLTGNDIGKPFRIAVAHAIDKRTIVTSLLQNFGVPGHTVVSPTNTLYYNASAPRYDFDLTVADQILDAAYGAWDLAPDACQTTGAGCRDLPGKGTGQIEILTPQADYDPIRAAAGTLIAQNLRKIGVNAISKPTAFGQIVTRVFDEQDFDMWILGWSLSGFIVPSYIESFYHSRHTGLGDDNAEGYINKSLDKVIDDAIGATDQAEAVRLWKWAQGIINTDMPTDTLYFRTNIFAFRQDKIDPDSWSVDIGGDIFTYWSWILLNPAPPGLIKTSLSAPSAVASGGTASVTVTVRDPDGNRLPGATVTVSVATGGGSISNPTGTTDSNGEFTTTFLAPTLNPTDSPVSSFIEARATSAEFGAARVVSIVITTFPPGAQFLASRVALPFGSAIASGGALVLEVSVTDQDGLPVAGASVAFQQNPTTPNLGLPSASNPLTTTAAGTVTASTTAPSVAEETTITVTVLATKGGLSAPSQTVTVTLLPPAAAPTPAGGLDMIFIVGGAVVGVGAAGGVYYGWRRRRMKQ